MEIVINAIIIIKKNETGKTTIKKWEAKLPPTWSQELRQRHRTEAAAAADLETATSSSFPLAALPATTHK